MYYPKSQIQENLYTSGDEYIIASTLEPYVGYYYQTSNNQRFTGKNPNDTPNFKLINKSSNILSSDNISAVEENSNPNTFWSNEYLELQNQQGIKPQNPPPPPIQIVPQPTKIDYTNGFFPRYFLYNFVNKTTIETNNSNYTMFMSNSPHAQYNRFTPLTLSWSLTGKYNSVFKSNKNNVSLLEQRTRSFGFSNFFKDKYSQYYQYKENENLYSNGKEIRYTKDKKLYIGYYHIHPEKGLMVGRQHTMKDHDYLEFITTGSILDPLPPTQQSGSYNEPSRVIPNTFGGY
tara:strand:- start:22 stop:888 length:867 start_codon:yes stop_codon:yes gene_type:complete